MDVLLSELPRTAAAAKAVGSTQYFTNKPCKNGHISPRLVSNGTCFECAAERRKAHYAANKESIREQRKAHRAANKESIREQKKAWYEANKESIRERRKAHFAANKESILEQRKAYREANKDHIKAYKESNKDAIREREKARYEQNKDAIRERQKNYQLRKRAERLGCSVEDLPRRAPQSPSRFVYLLLVKDGATHEKLFLKVGVSNNPPKRLKYHAHQLAKHGLIYDTILVKDFETAEVAREVEAQIKNTFMVYESGIVGFKNECFMYLPQFEESMLALLSK